MFYRVIVSALCFSFSFFVMPASIILMPASFILIFGALLENKLTFKLGFLWGCIVYTVQILPLLSIAYLTSTVISQIIPRVLVWLIMVIYTAFYAGLWFFFMQLSTARITHFVYKLCPAVLISLIFFTWLDLMFLWPFGLLEGYACIYPLVPLVYFLPSYVFFSGKSFVLFILLLFCSGIISLSFMHKKSALGGVFLVCYALIIMRTSSQVLQEQAPAWLKHVIRISPPWVFEPEKYSWVSARALGNLIEQALTHNIHAELIIFPESAFQYELNKYPEVLAYWQTISERSDSPDIGLIIGAHRRVGSHVYNSCYYIAQGAIKNYYDKQHGLLWLERVPSWSRYITCADICVERHRLFAQSEQARELFNWKDISFIPFICSDNFFSPKHDNYVGRKQIMLCLINDAWCRHSFLPQILYATVYLQARCTGLPVLYVSHTRGIFIDHEQREFELPFF